MQITAADDANDALGREGSGTALNTRVESLRVKDAFRDALSTCEDDRKFTLGYKILHPQNEPDDLPPHIPRIDWTFSQPQVVLDAPEQPLAEHFAPTPPRSRRPQGSTPNSNKSTKAHLKIASENMRGRSFPTIAGNLKWRSIAEDMRKDKIGVLALQETHLTDDLVEELNTFHKHLKIWNSSLPNNPTGAGGVALVFNKLLTNTETVQIFDLIPGRALLATWEWHKGDKFTILVVYAPTSKDDNYEFWRLIKRKIQDNRGKFPRPNVTLGDFNMVEEGIDRFPAKLNRIDNPDSFTELKRYLKMQDGWRDTFPNLTDWSWRNKSRSAMSRIDRIYMPKELIMASRDWAITFSGLNANDHSRVSVTVLNMDAPEIGRGRWSMSRDAAEDHVLLREANKEARSAWREMLDVKTDGRTQTRNPQRIWAAFKQKVVRAAKKRSRDLNLARTKDELRDEEARVAAKQDLLEALSADATAEATETLRSIEDKIHVNQEKKHKKVLERRDARNWASAETMSKSWFRWIKDNKPRDTIVSLRRPGSDPPEFVSDSSTMAKMAGEYHEQIQAAGLDVDERERKEASDEVLSHVETTLKPEDVEDMQSCIREDNVRESLLSAKAGSAAGLDGIIYEFWKALHRLWESSKGKNNDWVDIVAMMTMVYVDIEEHGVDESTGFADGWLCPLYKKGERSEIANYRPITLLNTDYKIYTKALALKLARVATYLIHESQVGFVRGRSISNLTKITSLILDYAEAFEQNGMIVALDQEKAYDRIRHDYLADTLRAFGFPQRLITVVESLYSNAFTSVMVNGQMSARYRVTRGVRQGDPLSCLLFNIAIEPLAASLRASDLRGFPIEGLADRLIASLYADDTTVYLSEFDSYESLTRILSLWCLASGAKFNTTKTEIIPLGSSTHRAIMIDSRLMREGGEALPPDIRIARDGETTRILGTWPGNGVRIAGAWTKILDRVHSTLDKWAERHPTMNGKAILTRTLIGGITQYLTAAQGMPKSIEKEIDKLVVSFMWDGAKKHPVNMATLRADRSSGGLEVFCAEDRNDAQYLVWLGLFLSPPSRRPTWAYLADPLFRAAITEAGKRRVPYDQLTNPFTQSWPLNERKLPFILKQMVRVARKYNFVLDAPEIPAHIKEQMNVWAHPALLNGDRKIGKPWTARCLKLHHAAATLEDLEEIAELDQEDHETDSTCACDNCTNDRVEGCRHPHKCQTMAFELLANVSEKWSMSLAHSEENYDLWDALFDQRASALDEGTAVVFDKDAILPNGPEDMGRVFVDSIGIAPAPAKEILRRSAGVKKDDAAHFESIQVVVCAGMTMDSTDLANGGFAISFPDKEFEDVALTCSGDGKTYLGALALGILTALDIIPGRTDVHLILTSRMMIQLMTTRLVHHERSGWRETGRAARGLRALAAALRGRTGEAAFTYVSKKHRKEWPEVREAQEVATGIASLHVNADLDLGRYASFDWPGISVVGIKQREATRVIRDARLAKAKPRRTTKANMDQIKSELAEHCNHSPTDDQIWAGLRSKDLSRQARNFLWKAVHGAHKVGPYFAKMPSPWKELAECPSCHVPETMEHILLDCQDSKQHIIWQLVGDLFKLRRIEAGVSFGTILGCANVHLEGFASNRDLPRERMYRIVVSESAFLAWKIRCEKRVEHADDPHWELSDAAVRERWQKMISTREWRDKFLARAERRSSLRGTKEFRVWGTWRDWSDPFCASTIQIHKELGVLVGRRSTRRGVG